MLKFFNNPPDWFGVSVGIASTLFIVIAATLPLWID